MSTEQQLSDILEIMHFMRDNMVSKQDAENFATKQDLERFATKEYLERFVTKNDLDDKLFTLKSDLMTHMDGVVTPSFTSGRRVPYRSSAT